MKIDYTLILLKDKNILVTDENISHGELYIDDTNSIRRSIGGDGEYWRARNNYKKVIAGIDNLPSLTYSDEVKSILKDKFGWLDVDELAQIDCQDLSYDDYKHLIKSYTLCEKDKENIINLYYKEGLTVKEIIKIYNSSTKAIGNILNITKRRRKSKNILQYDLEGTFIKKWVSSKEVEDKLGFNRTNINHAASGKYKNYKGFIWKYKS